jgi:thymidylate synthase
MKNYVELLQNILDNGKSHPDRTGSGRRTLFAQTLRFDLSTGQLPAVTTRPINPTLAIAEMLFFIAGHTNVAELNRHGFKLWNPWAVKDESFITLHKKLEEAGVMTAQQVAASLMHANMGFKGEIGPMYGAMWRGWPRVSQDIPKPGVMRTLDEMPKYFIEQMKKSYEELDATQKKQFTFENWVICNYYAAIDQLNELVQNLKKDPYSSRHLVTAFNPEYTPIPGYSPDENVLLGRGCLMPCHAFFQVVVTPPAHENEKPTLNLLMSMRSADVPVGVPHNIIGYAFLAALLAHCTDMNRGELVISMGDAHIYLNQIELAQMQVQREPLPAPVLELNPNKHDLFDFTLEDVTITGYQSHPEPIKYPVSV